MAGGADQGDDDIISGINVTPLVDVVLVLLIILMVTAKQLVQQDAIAMDLPQAPTGESQEAVPTEMRISLEADGTLHLNITQNGEQTLAQTQVTQAQLLERARAAHAADPEARAILSADSAAPHGSVIGVIDAAKTSPTHIPEHADANSLQHADPPENPRAFVLSRQLPFLPAP